VPDESEQAERHGANNPCKQSVEFSFIDYRTAVVLHVDGSEESEIREVF
jgi:hypothetical protein